MINKEMVMALNEVNKRWIGLMGDIKDTESALNFLTQLDPLPLPERFEIFLGIIDKEGKVISDLDEVDVFIENTEDGEYIGSFLQLYHDGRVGVESMVKDEFVESFVTDQVILTNIKEAKEILRKGPIKG